MHNLVGFSIDTSKREVKEQRTGFVEQETK